MNKIGDSMKKINFPLTVMIVGLLISGVLNYIGMLANNDSCLHAGVLTLGASFVIPVLIVQYKDARAKGYFRLRKLKKQQHVGPLYAVRGWDTPNFRYMRGVTREQWNNGYLEADCVHKGSKKHPYDQKVPYHKCSCGIYAYKDSKTWMRGDWYGMDVWGIVELSGRAIEHKRGYRGEKAKIVALCLNPKWKHYHDRLNPNFDVQIYTDFQAMCQEFGLLTDYNEKVQQ